MMSRVPRLHAAARALFSSVAHAQRGPRRAPLTEPGRVRVAWTALAFLLIAPAFAEDVQPDRAGEEPQASHHVGYRSVVRYPKPVMHNGHLVLWHGVWRGGRAHPRPGQAAAQPAQPAAEPVQEAATGAKPAGPRQLTILADSGDPTALRLAGELAGVMNGDDAQLKTFVGATSRAVMAKAVASDAADFALVPVDQLAEPGPGADWRQRAPYIARLHNEEIELVTPRSIADIRQLAGRKVNVGAADSAAAASAAAIFSRLNVAATWTNFTLREALQRLKDGRIDAVLTIGGRNSELLTAFGDDGRFHLATIPYAPALGAAYAPARASAKDWPKLVGADEKVDTLSVPLALVAVDGNEPERAQRLAPAVDRFLASFEQLLDETKDPGWREVNLAAQLDQTPRFAGAQTWLDQNKGAASADLDAFRAAAQAVDANGGPSGADSDRLYQGLIRLSGAGQ
jgi:TRAP-type uncharacterized transport system substrate-binding protein